MCCILQLIWLSDNGTIKELFEIMQILSYCCYNCLLHFHSNLNWNLAKTLQNLHQLLNTLATPTDTYPYVSVYVAFIFRQLGLFSRLYIVTSGRIYDSLEVKSGRIFIQHIYNFHGPCVGRWGTGTLSLLWEYSN